MTTVSQQAARDRLVREGPYRWVLPPRGAMRVPGVIFATEALLPGALEDQSVVQVENVATLPGVVRASYAMPDIHWGYGFPIGGVAATDVAAGGVVSPGGVGFDISCGVRLLAGELRRSQIAGRESALMSKLSREVPAGQGGGAIWPLRQPRDLRRVLREGAAAAVEAGFGSEQDLDTCEDRGVLPVSDTDAVSARAIERGLGQLGSLGSGNHFLELQEVEQIFDGAAAAAFGLRQGCVAVMIHSGSRGLGHQVCSDHVAEMVRQLAHYGIDLPDRQLACAPVESPHGSRYLSAMAAAANYGRANRQVMSAAVRRAFAELGAGELRVVYDISHNLAKLEEHDVDGGPRVLCVHRKGATRALPPGHTELPAGYQAHGQPVLVPGSMGTASYVLVGKPEGKAFHSTCHGAGRVMSRKRAMKGITGEALSRQLAESGITVTARSLRYLPEEQPDAYKDVSEVVQACEGAGLSRPVARLKPFGVLKG